MEPAWSGVSAVPKDVELAQREDKAHGDPDHGERDEYPQQERGLAERQPRELFALEEEPRAAGAVVSVVLDDLAGYRVRRLANGTAVPIAKNALGASAPIGRGHRLSVALGRVGPVAPAIEGAAER